MACTFEFILHFVRVPHGDSVTKPDYYNYCIYKKLLLLLLLSHSQLKSQSAVIVG